jgi:hypothetical protein
MSKAHLRPVGDGEAPQYVASIGDSGLPDFEGQPVMFSRLKLTSVSDLEVVDEANRMDDLVRLYVEGRVVRIDHVVDERSGQLKRVHTVKIIDAIQLPWDFNTGALDG